MENHAEPICPWGRMMKTARRGPIAEPVFPPTWKNDWAKPCFPPEAIRATRDDSGWKTAEPMPISAAARSSKGKVGAIASNRRPTSVKTIPMGREYGIGFRSV